MTQTQDNYQFHIEDGIVIVDYTFAGLETQIQRLAGLPLDDEAALTAAIADYGRAYKVGLEQEKATVTPSSKVEALQNQSRLIEEA